MLGTKEKSDIVVSTSLQITPALHFRCSDTGKKTEFSSIFFSQVTLLQENIWYSHLT